MAMNVRFGRIVHSFGIWGFGFLGIIGYILGLYWDSGKENGNYYNIWQKERAKKLIMHGERNL